MRQKVECSKCGSPNEISSMFCRECGAKLDFSTLQHEHFDDEGHPILKRVLEVIGVVLLVLLLVAVGLAFWPTAATGDVGTDEQAVETRRIIGRLYDATQKKVRARVVVNEPGMNAYLANVLRREQEESGDEGYLQAEAVNVSWDETSTRIHLTVKLGPLPITHLVEGTPSVGGGVFLFETDRAKTGHLPLFGPLAGIAKGAISGALSEMEHERLILDGLESIEFKEGQARVMTSGS